MYGNTEGGGWRKEPLIQFSLLSLPMPKKGWGESKMIALSFVVVVKNGNTIFLSCFALQKPLTPFSFPH